MGLIKDRVLNPIALPLKLQVKHGFADVRKQKRPPFAMGAIKMKRAFSLFLSLSLTGCSMMSAERVPCPRTAIIAEFAKSLEMQGGVPVRTDLDSLMPECTQDGNTTHVRFRLRMTSFRPLKNSHQATTLKPSYFVAIVDKVGNVLSRSDHDIEVTFEEKQTTKVSFLNVEEVVPAHKEVAIYVGFNLEEEQLQRLQKERRRK